MPFGGTNESKGLYSTVHLDAEGRVPKIGFGFDHSAKWLTDRWVGAGERNNVQGCRRVSNKPLPLGMRSIVF